VGLNFIANEPWAISEMGLQLVVAVATKDDFFAQVREKALAALDGAPLKNTRETTMRGDVAVIPVTGPLFRHANLMTDLSGATSYAALRKDLETALNDSSVKSIVLDIDSPGGEAKGVSELAGAIMAARAKKPIKAYVGGMAASAAYWLASATDEIIAADTAQLGSIGVIAVYPKGEIDDEIEIVSSQSPYKNAKPSTDIGKQKIQARIDALAEVFIGAVAAGRKVSTATVMKSFGQGDLLVGKHAVGAGMADRIGNFESLVSDMTSPFVKYGRDRIAAAEPMTVANFGRMEIFR
jgi:signal peptide peptidase SppA